MPRGPRGGLNPRPKPVLRSIRLDLPPDLLASGSPPPTNPIPPMQYSLPNVPIYNSFTPLTVINQTISVTLASPSVFLQFPQNSSPQFIFEALLPSGSFTFATQPDPSFQNARLLIYLVPINQSLPPFPVHFQLNNHLYQRVCGDGIPIDSTDMLNAFGHHNVLTVQRSNIHTPFLFIGVWANLLDLPTLIQLIGNNSPFESPLSLEFCPLSKGPIKNPARGRHCSHPQCFDAGAFITFAQATGQWICPICRVPLQLNDLMIDLTHQSLNNLIQVPQMIVDDFPFNPSSWDEHNIKDSSNDFTSFF